MKLKKVKMFKSLGMFLMLVLVMVMLPAASKAAAETQRDKVENFVERLYSILLGREVDAEGRKYWSDILIDGTDTGANVAAGIVFSEELVSRNLSNEDFVNCMYLTVFDREPDADGRNYWLDVLAQGETRAGMGRNLLNSPEFGEICAQYGITQGEAVIPDGAGGNTGTATIEMVQNFVKRLYSILLGREVDKEGLEYWTEVLVNQWDTGARVAGNIVFGDELRSRGLTNEEYVVCLYKTVFDREPEAEGKGYWVSVLDGGEPRNKVGANMLNSDEFGQICKNYNIVQGNIDVIPEEPEEPEVTITPTAVPTPGITETPGFVAADWEYKTAGNSVTITKYVGKSADIIVPQVIEGKKVTEIGANAFYWNKFIKNLTIPEGVRKIGNHAFDDCSNLVSVSLPDSLTHIGEEAFSFCTKLRSISLPKTVSLIGSAAFSNCSSLTSVIIPEGITWLNDYVFSSCTSLSIVELPEGFETLGNGTFGGCTNLTKVVLPDGLKTIGKATFMGCYKLSDIIIPSSVASIGEMAFGETSVIRLVIPEGVKRIRKGTFQFCSNLKSITIPNSVTLIGEEAFGGCSKLQDIIIPNSVTSIGEFAFSDCSSLNNVIIPEGVTLIDRFAFTGCSNLRSVTIPRSVTNIGGYAFSYAENLVACVYADSYAEQHMIEYNVPYIVLDDTGVSLEEIKASWEYEVYEDSVIVTKYIGENADAIVPQSIAGRKVTKIDGYTFYENSNLTSVILPEGIEEIGDCAFWGCSDLKSIVIPKGMKYIGNGAFSQCFSLSSVTLPEGLEIIASGAFAECGKLESIVLPEGIKCIGNSAFYDCSSLSSVTIPKQIGDVEPYAFVGTAWLQNREETILGTHYIYSGDEKMVVVPEGITSIEFLETGVEEVVLPSTLVEISDSAFFECTNLKTITIPEGVKIIERWAFWGCSSLTRVIIPKSVVEIGEGAFTACSGLKSIVIPEEVEEIASYAFQNCSSLSSIVLPISLESIGFGVFKNCNNLVAEVPSNSYAERYVKEQNIPYKSY